MAFVSESSLALSVDDWGPQGTNYSNCYAQANLTVETVGNKVRWTIKMKTSVGGTTSQKPGVSLYLAIDDQGILNNYWRYNESSTLWNNFPTLNDSTASGEITLNDANDTSIPVTLKIATSENATSNSTLWKSISGTLERTYYTNIGSTKVEIVDKGDNTFTINGTKGSAGTNNPAKGLTITYSYDSATYNKSASNGTPITLEGTNASRTVYAKAVTTATYGPNTEATASKTIKRYAAPNLSGKPTLTSASFKNNRLTNRTTWTYDWPDATAANSNSSVKKYFIRIFKNSTEVDAIDNLSESKYSFNPNTYGFIPGNKVKVSVWAWTTNGVNSVLWSNAITSDETLVENSAVAHINESGWKDGLVYINKGTLDSPNWVEAEDVYVKDSNGNWQTST